MYLTCPYIEPELSAYLPTKYTTPCLNLLSAQCRQHIILITVAVVHTKLQTLPLLSFPSPTCLLLFS